MTSPSLEQWQGFVESREEANFLQSIEWANANQKIGHQIVRQVVERNGQIVAGWQGIVKNAKRGRYLEVPGGPLVEWGREDIAKVVIQQLEAAGRERRCVFVRIRPQNIENDEIIQKLQSLGLKKAPFHLHAEHTNMIDLTKTEDELLAGMRRQTRYEVRQAAKKGVTVSWQNSQSAVEEFYRFQIDTAKRQGFIPPSLELLKAQVEAFGDKARIYKAEINGRPLSLALVLFSGAEADYFEAASTPDSRKFQSTYAVLWQSIKDAKALGKIRYNLWGIAYTDDPKHRYAGVTTFKRGFGGRDTVYVPAHDIIIDPLGYRINWLIETIRRKKRGL